MCRRRALRTSYNTSSFDRLLRKTRSALPEQYPMVILTSPRRQSRILRLSLSQILNSPRRHDIFSWQSPFMFMQDVVRQGRFR